MLMNLHLEAVSFCSDGVTLTAPWKAGLTLLMAMLDTVAEVMEAARYIILLEEPVEVPLILVTSMSVTVSSLYEPALTENKYPEQAVTATPPSMDLRVKEDTGPDMKVSRLTPHIALGG